jgi:hypothetical protein
LFRDRQASTNRIAFSRQAGNVSFCQHGLGKTLGPNNKAGRPIEYWKVTSDLNPA